MIQIFAYLNFTLGFIQNSVRVTPKWSRNILL